MKFVSIKYHCLYSEGGIVTPDRVVEFPERRYLNVSLAPPTTLVATFKGGSTIHHLKVRERLTHFSLLLPLLRVEEGRSCFSQLTSFECTYIKNTSHPSPSHPLRQALTQ